MNTIASPASSAAAITSSSRIDPPGWITAVAPASTAASSPSANGKNASEATAEPIVRGSAQPALSAASFAFHAAMRALFEAVHLPRADARGRAVLRIDDRVRLDVLGDGPGEAAVGQFLRRSARAWSRPVSSPSRPLSRACSSMPPAIDFSIMPPRAGSGSAPVRIRRRFFFFANTALAASSASGAATTSVKMPLIASAVGPSSGRLTAMIPPNADTLSQASAAS